MQLLRGSIDAQVAQLNSIDNFFFLHIVLFKCHHKQIWNEFFLDSFHKNSKQLIIGEILTSIQKEYLKYLLKILYGNI